MHYSVAVIGGGPVGMHVLGRAISEGVVPAEQTIIIDPHREPFAHWNRRVNNCGMEFLRSPASHGIARDYRTVRRAIRQEGDSIPPYHRPSVRLFAEHLNHHFERHLTGVHRAQGVVTGIATDASTAGYRINVSSDASITADSIILAVGQPPPYLPEVFRTLPTTAPMYHVHNDLSALKALAPGSEVSLVGGGIAAAHLAVSLSASGHHVTVWNRDRFTRHQFDSDPCFVGPRCASLFASIPNYEDRRALIRRSRRGGSVPPDLFQQLYALRQDRRLRLVRGTVTSVTTAGSRVVLHGTKLIGIARYPWATNVSMTKEYDAVVACTGFAGELPAAPLIRKVTRELRLPEADGGYPIPASDLQWGPGLFVTGALAELEIGPPARNLVGAHLAGRRIIPALKALLTVRK